MKYLITFSTDVGKLVPAVDKMLSSVNNTMAGFGYHEKMSITSTNIIPPLIMTVARELNVEEKATFEKIIMAHMLNAFPNVDLTMDSFEPYTEPLPEAEHTEHQE